MHQLFTPSLLALCLVVISACPAMAQSLLDMEWIAQATPAAVQAQLDRGATLTARDQNGMTPLHGAARYNATPAAVQAQLDRGATLTARDQNGMTPLHGAARYNANPAVVSLLLDRGADPTLHDDGGRLPIQYAEGNEQFRGTDVYWRLHDASF